VKRRFASLRRERKDLISTSEEDAQLGSGTVLGGRILGV
jgi:hypothetical protein